jgi:hypothetical protein
LLPSTAVSHLLQYSRLPRSTLCHLAHLLRSLLPLFSLLRTASSATTSTGDDSGESEQRRVMTEELPLLVNGLRCWFLKGFCGEAGRRRKCSGASLSPSFSIQLSLVEDMLKKARGITVGLRYRKNLGRGKLRRTRDVYCFLPPDQRAKPVVWIPTVHETYLVLKEGERDERRGKGERGRERRKRTSIEHPSDGLVRQVIDTLRLDVVRGKRRENDGSRSSQEQPVGFPCQFPCKKGEEEG